MATFFPPLPTWLGGSRCLSLVFLAFSKDQLGYPQFFRADSMCVCSNSTVTPAVYQHENSKRSWQLCMKLSQITYPERLTRCLKQFHGYDFFIPTCHVKWQTQTNTKLSQTTYPEKLTRCLRQYVVEINKKLELTLNDLILRLIPSTYYKGIPFTSRDRRGSLCSARSHIFDSLNCKPPLLLRVGCSTCSQIASLTPLSK